jgi:hypothetical protein
MPRGQVFRSTALAVRPKPEALTASARVFSGPGAESIDRNSRRNRHSTAWARPLWDYFDTVPEYRSACSWVGNLLSKAVLGVTFQGKPTTNEHALNALASRFGGRDGQEEMLRLLGLNFTVAGEAWIFGRQDQNGNDKWEVVAGVEVTVEGSGPNTIISIEGEVQPKGIVAIRLWKSHPRKSAEADTPSRALIPVLAEITALTQVVAAQAASRLTSSGILWVPAELELPALPMQVGADDDAQTIQQAGAEGLTALLTRVASLAIGDRSSAAANVPVVIAAPGEHLSKVQKTEFWSGFDAAAKELRDEATKRIGIGMDMPPEALTGTGDMNHWSSFQMEESAIKLHSEPLLAIVVRELGNGYLIPYLQAMGVENAEDYAFKADTSALRVRPNRSKEAIELYDRGALNRRTLLVENGFDPEVDAMDDKEFRLWMLQRLADGSSTPDQVAIAYHLLGIPEIPVAPEEPMVLEEVREARPTRSLTEHPSRSMPDPEDSEAEGAVNASATLITNANEMRAFIVDGLVLASEAHVYRALERAGNRIRAKVGKSIGTEAADVYMSVPTFDYAECEALLEDAWSRLDRFAYQGVSTEQLRSALHEYTLMLLRSQKPLTRASLSRHLMLEMADA